MRHRRADGIRIDRIEHLKPRESRRDAHDTAQDLGRQARAAHAEQHDVGDAARSDRFADGAQPRQLRRDEREALEPTKTIRDLLLHRRIGAPHVEPA